VRDGERGGSEWLLVASLFAFTLLVESLSWNQLTAYAPLYMRELHVPQGQVAGWIAAISSVSWLLALPFAPFWGVLADRYSRKLIIVRTAALEAVIFAGWAFSTSPWMVLGFMALNGFILGNTGVMLAVQASTTPRQRLGLAVGLVSVGSPLGRAVGPISGAALVHLVDVKGMLLFGAGISAAAALLLTVLLPEGEHVRPVDVRVLSMLRGALGEIASRPVLWRLFVAMTVAQVGVWTMYPFVPIFIARFAPADPVTAVGLILTAVGVAAAIGSPLWGLAMSRVGHVAVLSAACAGSCVSLVIAGASSSLPVFAFGLVLNSVFSAAILTASMAVMAAVVSPERRGAILGQIMFPFYIAGVVGPLIGGAAFAFGQAAVFGIAAVLLLAPLTVLATMRRIPQTTPA
jgi:MFS family permease